MKRIAILIIVLAALVIIVPTAVMKRKHDLVRERAWQALVASRPHLGSDPDSYDFMSYGIRYGMTISEVDSILAGASERQGRTFPGERGSKLYIFRYGDPFHDPFTGKSSHLMEDSLYVNFDEHGRAYHVVYNRSRRRLKPSRFVEFDLKSGEVRDRSQ
jgi:hypothetical protein